MTCWARAENEENQNEATTPSRHGSNGIRLALSSRRGRHDGVAKCRAGSIDASETVRLRSLSFSYRL
jgi:hypothetical protein